LRRLSVAAAVVGLGALVFTAGAQACSCAPRGPVEALKHSDAAIVAQLVKVIPRGRLHADYRYRIRRVYRGARVLERGDVIAVRSARRASACGLPRNRERAIGLFLLRDERGHWTAGLCGTIAPRLLWRAAKRASKDARPAGAQVSCAS
jgi:hypothetical protein